MRSVVRFACYASVDHPGLASANDYLAKLAGTLEIPGPLVHRQVVVGPSVSAAILNEVRDNHIGALVMATHGRTACCGRCLVASQPRRSL